MSLTFIMEFKVAGHIHKVAIECKNYKNPISIDIIDGFIGKLQDFNNVILEEDKQNIAFYYSPDEIRNEFLLD